jgi:hypothetical protein
MRHIENMQNHWLVNHRYAIYFDGVVYDTQMHEKAARDIPYYIFDLRDKLISERANHANNSIHA